MRQNPERNPSPPLEGGLIAEVAKRLRRSPTLAVERALARARPKVRARMEALRPQMDASGVTSEGREKMERLLLIDEVMSAEPLDSPVRGTVAEGLPEAILAALREPTLEAFDREQRREWREKLL